MDVKINYRPRPIDIYAELPIITDPNLQKEIEIENAKYEALQQRKKKRKVCVTLLLISHSVSLITTSDRRL